MEQNKSSYYKKVEEVLRTEGMYAGFISGVSMYPMLRQGRDTVVIMPCKGRLKKYDIPLYRRGKDYVLHRILEVHPDSYVILGDNCMKKEYGVTDDQIVGVLTAFYRDENEVNMNGIGYKSYVWFWCHTIGLRVLLKRVYSKLCQRQTAIS